MKTGLLLESLRSRDALKILVAIFVLMLYGAVPSVWAQSCTPESANPIVCENALPGTTGWQVGGVGDTSIQGFATDISVNAGSTISFKIKTNASNYRIDIYRLGYYGGAGARKVATITPSVTLPQNQPACLTDAATNLTDCGNWAVSASWQVPSTAISGIYIAAPVRADTGGASHIVFVVRNDNRNSTILFQTSDETWHAYNDYGGHSLYGGANTWDLSNRAYKVSYNRPFNTRNFEAASFVLYAEYPMVRWLEANGYDVAYFTGVDAARFGNLIQNHKLYLSVGHDEYWSGPQRTNVEAARDAGVNLAFFSGNEVFWKTRWENSIDSSNTSYRTMVCYKETLDNTVTDPADPPTWTGTWADPRFSPPGDGGRPQNSLTGTLFTVNGPGPDNMALSIQVPAADGKMRFWRNTSIASLAANQTATLPAGTLGYEWDSDVDNGARPAGLFNLSTATYPMTVDYLLDYGATYGAGTATHRLTMYKAPSGALVFGAGTVQWSWGLDANHDTDWYSGSAADVRMQQATVNLFADMGVQPTNLQAGLVAATKSTDISAPISAITFPANGATVEFGSMVTITGTATDNGGGMVAGVEVSVDGGLTWHPASGRANWTYQWMTAIPATGHIMSRAVDDSGNLETPGAGVTVTVPRPLSPISLDTSAFGDAPSASTTVQTASFSTTGPNELLLAFISADYLSGANTSVSNVSGAGLTWTLVQRTNVQSGTAEIWRAFAPTPLSNVKVTATLSQNVVSSITVQALSGVDTSGTNGSGAIGAVGTGNSRSGAPTASLVTTRNSSWVFGVGTDYDNPVARVPQGGQTLIHQYLTPTGDTYWVQMMSAPTPLNGTTVTIKDTSPTGDRYNLSICEVLPSTVATWSISGTITPSSGGSGALLLLSGAASATATADSSGNYTLAGLANGSYTVTPSKSGYTFSPPSQTITVSGANVSSVNFTATAVPTYHISGSITPGSAGSGTLLSMTASSENGSAPPPVTADASGNFSFSGIPAGSYTITPSKTGYAFTPVKQSVMVVSSDVTGVNFAATAVQTWSVSGTVSPAAAGAGTLLTVSGSSSASGTADGSGNFTVSGLADGTYTVTPTKAGYTFSPSSQSITINGANITALSFTAQALPPPPVITGLVATPGSTSATITWTTNVAASSQVNYGTSSGVLNLNSFDPTLATSHSITLTGLTPSTTYYYTVTSVDAFSNSVTSPASPNPPLSFSTSSNGPPVISAVTAAPGTGGTATITWTTDSASTSRVDYGTTAASLNLNVSDTSLVTSHSIALTGLTVGTTYYYRVTSTDSASRSTTSPASPSAPANFVENAPVSIWTSTATPITASDPDTNSAELGVKFRSDVAGVVTGVRFYKGSQNTGTHVGNLWSNAGALLASVTFSGETASGWQQATFSTPVTITPNTTYIVSYFAPSGRYAADESALASGVDNAPLHALADGVDGPNGVYAYGATSSFPTQSFNATNYWVDGVFVPSTSPSGPVISAVIATPSTTSATITWTTNVPATSRVDFGTSSSSLSQNASDATLTTAHSLTLSGLTAGTTYYYRVTSADGSSNSSSFPSAPSGPATFATINNAPPVISAVTAVPGNGGTATIMWTTNIASDSRVDYDTTSGSLSLNAVNATLATAHSITLTGLTTGTTYYFRVTSTTAAGASTTSPATSGSPASFVESAAMTSSIWSSSSTPPLVDSADPNAVELGMKFRSDVAGYVTGVRFYKSAANTGVH
ncbi:MAG TPA: N,N-dimethylformamidase beta subunit family domain-containing protein, partial [Bryobacteraceae bacterium]|nr:N,N-dimethylformamidase beta subunit family domain-containing protein [Bryobacteraceae bacterium]